MQEQIHSGNGKQIVATKGEILAIYRFINRLIYIKINNVSQAGQIIQNLKKLGANIKFGRTWIECDILKDHTEAKLGAITLDLTIVSNETIQNSLCDFFYGFLTQGGFKCEVSNL